MEEDLKEEKMEDNLKKMEEDLKKENGRQPQTQFKKINLDLL